MLRSFLSPGRLRCGCLLLFISLITPGCFNLSVGDGGGGCSTVGEKGNVDYDFDLGRLSDLSAGNGRVWAVGAVASLTLRADETNDELTDVTLKSTHPDVMQFAFIPDGAEGAGPGRAFIQVLKPGRTDLEVWRSGELFDTVELAADTPSFILSTMANTTYRDATQGLEYDGFGEPGLVLKTGASCGLFVTASNSDFKRLVGSIPIEATSSDPTIATVTATVTLSPKRQSSTMDFEVRSLRAGEAELTYTFAGITDRFPVRVEDQPAVAHLQIAIESSGYGAWSAQAFRTIGTAGEESPGMIVPRAFDSARWPIHGLSFEYGYSGAALQIESVAGGELATFLPTERGDVTIWVRTTGAHPMRTEESYYVE